MKFLVILATSILVARATTTVSTEGPDLGIVRHDLCSGMKFSKQEIQIVEQLNCEYYCQEEKMCTGGQCHGSGDKWSCECYGCGNESGTPSEKPYFKTL